ncbi:uncharacterized protein N7459_001674 [Penicillium hispanicum]|uniref:uncharacterized protein n=1 Tax=Penicillium hispanicum TaxID=1080232 RepID=UPI0025404C87|nr:uncharacterized protein N7459_001674 [Penicillium hispanicum]KAJ5595466.1 hypothetical protein N7459_001674 [Penicillium hispanicum]
MHPALNEGFSSNVTEMKSFLRRARGARSSTKHVRLILRFGGRLVDNHLEQEIRQIRHTVATDQEASPVSSTAHAEPSAENASSGGEDLPNAETLRFNLLQQGILCSNQVLERVDISPLVFCDLFLAFYRHYHPRFPLLPDLMECMRNCTSCPLLFWAVVAIASGISETHRDLHLQLIGPVRRLAGIEITRTEASSIPLIHALLVLCCWPQPFGAMATDPSWMYCGSAIHMALKMGLHRPANLIGSISGTRISEVQSLMRTKTWVACFIVNQSLSCHLGMPSTLKLDHTILQSLGSWPASLPTSIRDLLQVAYKSFSFSGILGHYEGAPDGLLPDPMPIIESYGADLNALETANWELWDLPTKMSFLGTKLHLYAYNLTAKHHAISSLPIPDRRSHYYFSEAYTTAIRLIRTWCGPQSPTQTAATPGTLISELSLSNLARSWTIFEKLSLTYAVLSLLKLTKLSPITNSHDINTDNAIRQALAFLKSCSVFKDDHCSRLCDIIEYICHLDSTGSTDDGSPSSSSSHNTPEVRSHMSSNVLLDVVLRAKERFQRNGGYPYGNPTPPLQEGDRERDRESGPHLSPSLLADPFPSGFLPDPSPWSAWELDFIDLLGGETIL